MKHHATDWRRDCVAPGLREELFHVPPNRFTFAIRVGGDEDLACAFGDPLEVGEDVFFAFDGHVLRCEAVLDIDAEFFGREIADMTDRGADGHVQISFEDLIALDPDIIIVSMPLHQGAGTQGDRGGASQRLLETEPSLRGLRAIQKKHILALPPSLFASGSQSIVRGAEMLAAQVDALLARETHEPEQHE